MKKRLLWVYVLFISILLNGASVFADSSVALIVVNKNSLGSVEREFHKLMEAGGGVDIIDANDIRNDLINLDKYNTLACFTYGSYSKVTAFDQNVVDSVMDRVSDGATFISNREAGAAKFLNLSGYMNAVNSNGWYPALRDSVFFTSITDNEPLFQNVKFFAGNPKSQPVSYWGRVNHEALIFRVDNRRSYTGRYVATGHYDSNVTPNRYLASGFGTGFSVGNINENWWPEWKRGSGRIILATGLNWTFDQSRQSGGYIGIAGRQILRNIGSGFSLINQKPCPYKDEIVDKSNIEIKGALEIFNPHVIFNRFEKRDLDSIAELINPDQPTIILVHGWRSPGTILWEKDEPAAAIEDLNPNDEYIPIRFSFQNLGRSLYKKHNLNLPERYHANIIAYNWEYESQSTISTFPVNYITPPGGSVNNQASNLKKQLEYVFDKASESQDFSGDIHIIGHSLGAGIVAKLSSAMSREADNKYFEHIKFLTLFDPPERIYTDIPFWKNGVNISDDLKTVREASGERIKIYNYIANNKVLKRKQLIEAMGFETCLPFPDNHGIPYDDAVNIYINDYGHSGIPLWYRETILDNNYNNDCPGEMDSIDKNNYGYSYDPLRSDITQLEPGSFYSNDIESPETEVLDGCYNDNTCGDGIENTNLKRSWQIIESTEQEIIDFESLVEYAYITSIIPDGSFVADGIAYIKDKQLIRLISSSPSMITKQISISHKVLGISFDYKGKGLTNGDRIVLALDDNIIFSTVITEANNGIWINSGLTKIPSELLGKSKLLSIALVSDQAGHELEIQNIQLYEALQDQTILGDLDGNGCVDVDDYYNIFQPAFGYSIGDEGYDPSCDFDNDGQITLLDLQKLYQYYMDYMASIAPQ